MIRIGFVDDEPRILDGLRRMLRPMRNEWDMQFFGNGHDALACMESEPFDVLVTDVKMPVIDGVELMKMVNARYPGTVRIALSGHSDKEMLLGACEAAHQFLSKPCDAQTLSQTLKQVCATRGLLKDPAVRALVDGDDGLPSLPLLYQEIQLALLDENCSLAEIGNIIERDVAMTAKMLRFVNSAFFGLPREVSSAAQAASLLGLEVVKGLVLGTTVFNTFEQNRSSELDLDVLWSHCLRTSVLARDLAAFAGMSKRDVENAQVAGMLHDVGHLLIGTRMPEPYAEVRALVRTQGMGLYQAEEEILGFNHMNIGAYLLSIWGLPESVVDVAMHHHRPGNSDTDTFSALTCVHILHHMFELEDGHSEGNFDEEYLRSVAGLDIMEKFMASQDASAPGVLA